MQLEKQQPCEMTWVRLDRIRSDCLLGKHCSGTEESGLCVFIYFRNYKMFHISPLKVLMQYFEAVIKVLPFVGSFL